MVKKTEGDNYEIIEHNNNLYVRGEYKLTVDGATEVLIKNKVDLKVYGDTNATFYNNLSMNVAGDANMVVGGDMKLKAKSLKVETLNDLNVFSGGSAKHYATKKFSIRTPGMIAFDGSSMSWQSNQSDIATTTSLSAPSTKSFSDIDIKNLIRPDCTPDAFDLDAGEPGAKDVHSSQVESGEFTPTTSQEIASTTVKENSLKGVPCNCTEFNSINEFPGTIKLSKYFTLADLSSNSAVVKEAVVSQRGLPKRQIVCNLKNLAVNCLDKIKDKYPDMFVTNAFRIDKAGRSAVSDHGTGMAADIQFSKASRSDYYSIVQWISENVPFKQLLLEYGGGAINPWIHIAFDISGQKSKVPYGTFKDHAMYAKNKFVNLG